MVSIRLLATRAALGCADMRVGAALRSFDGRTGVLDASPDVFPDVSHGPVDPWHDC
jgi:hypothetical protein